MTRRNLEMYRGDTYPFEVVVENAGNPVNISGFQFRMTCKYRVQDPDNQAVFTLTSPTNIVVTDAVNGELFITIPPSATSSLQAYVYHLWYDIQAYNDINTVYTICSGQIVINPDCSITTP